jgi:hypothetical protein
MIQLHSSQEKIESKHALSGPGLAARLASPPLHKEERKRPDGEEERRIELTG